MGFKFDIGDRVIITVDGGLMYGKGNCAHSWTSEMSSYVNNGNVYTIGTRDIDWSRNLPAYCLEGSDRGGGFSWDERCLQYEHEPVEEGLTTQPLLSLFGGEI